MSNTLPNDPRAGLRLGDPLVDMQQLSAKLKGTPQFMHSGQIWYVGDRGGGPFEVAATLHGFIDPKTRAIIPNDTYLLPCSNCLAPNPTPTTMDPTNTGTAAAVMGFDTNGDPRTILYIQSGFDPAPVRLYYLNPQ